MSKEVRRLQIRLPKSMEVFGVLCQLGKLIDLIPPMSPIPNAIIDFISNLPNPSNTVLLQKPEVDSKLRN